MINSRPLREIYHKCSFCRERIKESSEDNLIIQSLVDSNVFICYKCLKELHDKINPIMVKKNDIKKKQDNKNKLPKPSEIKTYLNSYIIGQDKAKEILSVAVYNHYKSIKIKEKEPNIELEKSNILMLGPSGCGKTAIVKALSKMLNVPFAIGDATCLTEAGYVGSDVEVILQKLLDNANGNVEEAQKGIIYIDEIDKLSRKGPNISTTASPGREGVQQSLLKMIEGSIIDVQPKGNRKHPEAETVKIDTSNILFIVGGAFEGIEKIIDKRLKTGKSSIGFESTIEKIIDKDYNKTITQVTVEDLKNFGMLPEFLGRLPIVCPMEELTKEALVRILTEPKNSLLKQYKRLLQEDNISLEFSKEALEAVANKALKRKTGARSLRSILEEMLNSVMYKAPELSTNKIKVDYSKEKDFIIKNY